jgi:hypothetical protein
MSKVLHVQHIAFDHDPFESLAEESGTDEVRLISTSELSRPSTTPGCFNKDVPDVQCGDVGVTI